MFGLEYGLFIHAEKFFQTLVDADLHAFQQVLLLDEPTSALDPISTHHIEDTVLQLKKTRGLTVIMVSHSIEQVKRLVDVVCVVVAGKLVEVLKIEDLDNASNPQAQEFLHEAQRK